MQDALDLCKEESKAAPAPRVGAWAWGWKTVRFWQVAAAAPLPHVSPITFTVVGSCRAYGGGKDQEPHSLHSPCAVAHGYD